MANITSSWLIWPTAISTDHGSFSSAWLLGAVVFGSYFVSVTVSQIFGYQVPIFGIKNQFEPIVVSNFRFFQHAEEILNEGYRAVS